MRPRRPLRPRVFDLVLFFYFLFLERPVKCGTRRSASLHFPSLAPSALDSTVSQRRTVPFRSPPLRSPPPVCVRMRVFTPCAPRDFFFLLFLRVRLGHIAKCPSARSTHPEIASPFAPLPSFRIANSLCDGLSVKPRIKNGLAPILDFFFLYYFPPILLFLRVNIVFFIIILFLFLCSL